MVCLAGRCPVEARALASIRASLADRLRVGLGLDAHDSSLLFFGGSPSGEYVIQYFSSFAFLFVGGI